MCVLQKLVLFENIFYYYLKIRLVGALRLLLRENTELSLHY